MMPVYLYLKSVSRITLSSIFASFHKLVFLGGILSLVSTFLRLLHLAVNRNLYLNLKSAAGKDSSKTPNFVQWLRRKGKMTPIIKSICSELCEGKELPKMPISSNMGGSSVKKFAPLLVAFVGIPARGKTVTAHKLARYLNWTGETAKVFTVSEYRRKLLEQYDSHDLFRTDNREALEIRRKCSLAAMEDAAQWLRGGGHVAVLDGTNATRAQREGLHEYFVKQLGYKLLFVESVVDDDDILSRNVKEILQNSPDYKDMAEEKALNDFQQKIQHYLEQYEQMDAKQESYLRYIKLINEGESISTYHLSGRLESHILGFLSNFKPGPKTLYFSRHGESENNVLGRIGGDTNLSPRGWKYAHSLACYINEAKIEGLRVWTSELRRTKQTAEGIEAPAEHVSALNELNAGVCEGMTYEEMQDKFPQEFAWRDQDKLHYRYPWGESYVDIMNRLNPVILELEHENNLLIVSHQAVLRCILGYFLNKKPEELPYINVPLHTLIKITAQGYSCCMELTKLNVECVDTYRKQPKNCSTNRTAADALVTVPSHLDNLNFWQLNGHSSLITQH